MLSKLFGINKKSKTHQPPQVEDSKSKLLNLVDSFDKKGMGKMYPILKPNDWVAKPHAVYIPWIGGEENPQIIIAFGWDANENLTFLTNQKAEGLRKSEIYDLALKNISAYPGTIKLIDVDGYKIATASGKDFSAEKILDPNFLLEVSSHLDSNELLISIPRRSCFMACDKNTPSAFLNKFQALHLHAWNDDSYGNAPIANGIFEVKSGKVVSYIPL